MKHQATAYSISVLMLLGAACGEVELPEDIVDPGFRPVERAAKAPPIMGGTTLVTRDGAYAVVSDPLRDSIHVVDLHAWKEAGTIELGEDALPFRGVEDASGNVHVTLRGTGEVVTLDPGSAAVTSTTRVCPNPRGIDFDPAVGALRVACAGGLLVTLPVAGGAPTQRFIAPDLRDVFVAEGRVFVTRFRAAEVLEVDDEDGSTLHGTPITLVKGASSREPTTAWRTLARPGGGWVMLHQSASTDPVPGFDEPDADSAGPSEGGYVGKDPCAVAVNPTLSATADDGIVHTAGLFGRVALSVDAAISPDGRRVAFATPSQQDVLSGGAGLSVFEFELGGFSPDPDVDCRVPSPIPLDPRDDIVAIAYQPDGALLAQARDQPILYRMHGDTAEKLELSGADIADTGLELFHYDAGQGMSCASCHPEGGQDGRTWVFEDIGPRRTQPLNVGLEGTAPFHWKGDMDDIHMIARQVRQRAMGGVALSEERQAALRDWMFTLRPPNPLRPPSDGDVASGAQLFGALGCASCHAGPSFTSPSSNDLGHGLLQPPALRGVALRPPYMHDGRAGTLEDAVLDMVTTTAPTADLEAQDVASLVAYLESL